MSERARNRVIRSKIMASIRGRDTTPELIVRRSLHAAGFRYSLRRRVLGMRPDLVMPKHQAVILVHGCFWHHHQHCRRSSNPKSRRAFWREKFKANMARDERQKRELLNGGWRVAVVWECSLSEQEKAKSIGRLQRWILGSQSSIVVG